MYFDDITDDIYSIPEDGSIKKSKFTGNNKLNDKIYTEKHDNQFNNIEQNLKENINLTNNVNKEVKNSQINPDNVKKLQHMIDTKANNTKNLPYDFSNNHNFNLNTKSPVKYKEKDESLNLSEILDETEPKKKIDNKPKENKIYDIEQYEQKQEERIPQFKDKKDLQNHNLKQKNKNSKKNEESINLSEILDESVPTNKNKTKKKCIIQDEIQLNTNNKIIILNSKKENAIKGNFYNENHSISDISTKNYNKNSQIHHEDINSFSTNKNTEFQNENHSRISNKTHNGGVNNYIQTKISQVEGEYLNSKHQFDKYLINDENKIIKYETIFQYDKVYDLLRKQNYELVKNLEKMNSYLSAIIEGTKLPKQQGSKKKVISKPSKESLEVDNKIISVYKKEYKTISIRLTQVSESNYLFRLENILFEMNSQISHIENENKTARNDQKQTESKIGKVNKNKETDGANSEIKKINYDYEHYNKQFKLANSRITKNKEEIENYNENIEKSNQKFLKLVEIGNYYGMTESEVKHIEENIVLNNNNLDNNSLKNMLIKKTEIINKVKEQNKNKYENQIKGNVTTIFKLETTKKEIILSLNEKSKIAKTNNEKVREFYEIHTNKNVSNVTKDLKKLNETMDINPNNHNITNYSTGHIKNRHILSNITEEINSGNITPSSRKNVTKQLIPIDEKERDLEETIGRSRPDEILNNNVSNIEIQKNNLNEMSKDKKDNVINDNKEKDKYGIKQKPNFSFLTSNNNNTIMALNNSNNNLKEGKDNKDIENKDNPITVKPIIKEDNKININSKNNEKQQEIIAKPKEILNNPGGKKEETNLDNESKDILNKEKKSTYNDHLEMKNKSKFIQEELVFDDSNSRRKKINIVQNNSNFPIIENKEAKEAEERERIRGHLNNNEKLISKDTHIKQEEKIFKNEAFINDKILSKENYIKKEEPKTIKKEEKANLNEEKMQLKENTTKKNSLINQEIDSDFKNIPLFSQDIVNKNLNDNKIDSKNKLNEKIENPNNFFSDNRHKEDKSSSNDKKDVNVKILQKNTTNDAKIDNKIQTNEVKKQEEKIIPKKEENKSLFSNIFNDDDDDDKKDHKIEKATTKKMEDFDKLFNKEVAPNNKIIGDSLKTKVLNDNQIATKDNTESNKLKVDQSKKEDKNKAIIDNINKKETKLQKQATTKSVFDDLEELLI